MGGRGLRVLRFQCLFIVTLFTTKAFADPAVDYHCLDLLPQLSTGLKLGIFPPRTHVDEYGVLEGTDQIPVTAVTMVEAYQLGIIPWPDEDGNVNWTVPDRRGVLFFNELRTSHSLAKQMRKNERTKQYRISFDQAFERVLREVQLAVKHGQASWLDDNFFETYRQLFRYGLAHSTEVWEEDELVGGTFGVFIGGVYSGESMFHRKTDVVKLALMALNHHLMERDVQWIDIQEVAEGSPRALMGAREISQNQYYKLLKAAHQNPIAFYEIP